MKLKVKFKIKEPSTRVNEVAKWRSTKFSTELTQEIIDDFVDKYGAESLGIHYDDGVPTSQSGEKTTPQKSFNPKATWQTPVGIYYYPLSWAKDKIMVNDIPFAGNKKYVYIYHIKNLGKRLDVSEAPYNGFLERALMWATKNSDLAKALRDSGIRGDAYYKIINLYSVRNTSSSSSMPPAGTVAKFFVGADEQELANKTFYIVNNMLDRNVARVTKYFISEGYEVLEDRNDTGTIHTDETTQGIYLTTSAVELLGSFLNRFRSGRNKPAHLNLKQMDPDFLREKLQSGKGKNFVDTAFQYARKYEPAELNNFIKYIFLNDAIPKNRVLADKIANNAYIGDIHYNNVAKYINEFTSSLKPDELEQQLSKIVTDKVKKTIDDQIVELPIKIVKSFKDTFENLNLKYGSKFDINEYPTLSYLNKATQKAISEDELY